MRTNSFVILLFVILFSNCTSAEVDRQELMLQYNSPAQIWEATLPLGNGRIGMMPDGGVESEKIVLNDITMWSGSQDPEALNPEAIDYLPQIRQLLLEGKNLDAQKLMYKHFRCSGQGSGSGHGKDVPYGCFQMVGDLNINYTYPTEAKATDYSRSLLLNDAVASTSFRKDGANYNREYFVSHKNDVMIIRLTADKKKSIAFDVELSRPERAEVYLKDNAMYMKGQLNDGHNTDKGVSYLTKVELINKGGLLSAKNHSLSISDADEVLILISTVTNMLDKSYKNTVEKLMTDASAIDYKQL
ncbi:MAG: glycoside hydrolase family 95 protein, partial [Bacteroidaceae bacterium]